MQLSVVAQPIWCGTDLLPQPTGLSTIPTSSARRAADDTTTYTIPVVFLIYHLGEPVGTGSNVSDAAIQYQMNLMNQRYAGIGINDVGQNAKIRFVFARRTPLCNATSGIVRLNARHVPNYEATGFNVNNYPMIQQLDSLAPDFQNRGPMDGVAIIKVMHYIPPPGNFTLGSIFLTAETIRLTEPDNHVVSHEMGHLLSLFHPYQGSRPVSPGSFEYTCPTSTDNDEVEDTPPVRLNDPITFGDICSPQAETAINSCTGQAFGTILRNIMSFGCNQDRFTPGQIARMRTSLANQLYWLAHSRLDLDALPNEVITPVQCVLSLPQPPSTYFKPEGINLVQFETINLVSAAFPGGRYQEYSCIHTTQVTAGQSYPLTVRGYGTLGRVYIDYNNDGTFDETTERVMSFAMASNEQESTATQLITIPSTATTNQKLRMRVILDCGSIPPTACQLSGELQRGSGEVEDYGIMIQAPSCMTIKEGLWNDVSIWSCGRIPTSLDAVHIKHTVTIPEHYQAEASQLSYELSGQIIYNNSGRLLLSNE